MIIYKGFVYKNPIKRLFNLQESLSLSDNRQVWSSLSLITRDVLNSF